MTKPATVIAVAADSKHNFTKPARESISLLKGLGVDGDAHAGKTVQHRYDKRKNPDAPNLRQVHLIHAELHDEVAALGMTVLPGQMGENITTRGIDLLSLSRGTELHIGEAIITVTGLRNPCKYLNQIQPGLMKACIGTWDDGTTLVKTGVMGVITRGGVVSPNDPISVHPPAGAHQRLAAV